MEEASVSKATIITTTAPKPACSTRVTDKGIHGRVWKAMTKVSRYSASGITHRKGAEATSVERWAVTPSIRLDGAAASRISTAFSRHGIGGEAASGAGSASRS